VKSRTQDRAHWYRIDLHTHTPASADYHQPDIAYLEILQRAELRGIDIIAFTDHNTVTGYATLMNQVQQLEFLAARGVASSDEQRLLAEYHRLLDKILVLPGFEFTATFGFHILGIFPPDTPVRRVEHVLLSLRVPYEAIERGLTEVGASADVLTAYRAIRDAGGLVIAAHVNAAHGVAMWNLDFGGQTRIAYTQDPSLHALEVTDLGKRGRHNTQAFFQGSKPEYPRAMRCIQGSDAHRLDNQIDRNGKVVNFGVGERASEARLRDRTFDALKEMFESDDFTTTRAYNPAAKPKDPILSARADGATATQAFHESATQAGVLRLNLLTDICAFANSEGGTLYLGLSADPRSTPVGVDNPQAVADQLQRAVSAMIKPSLQLAIDTPDSNGKLILRVRVPRGAERPYALEGSKIYVRSGSESRLATRDEIILMVVGGERIADLPRPVETLPPPTPVERPALPERREPRQRPPERRDYERERPERPQRVERADRPERRERPQPVDAAPMPERQERPVPPRREERPAPPSRRPEPAREVAPTDLPRIGVELVDVEQRSGINIYTLRDLQTNAVVKNITRVTKAKAWQYVIKQHERNPIQLERVRWNGVCGLWRKYRRQIEVRYDLVLQTEDGPRYFYSIPESELKGGWLAFKDVQAQAEDAAPVENGSAPVETPAEIEAPVIAAEAEQSPVEVVATSVDGQQQDGAKKKRRRRGGRGRRKGGAQQPAAQEAAPTPQPEPVAEIAAPVAEAPQVRRRRGRPPKAAAASAPEPVVAPPQETAAEVPPPKARRRGRPPKSASTPAPEVVPVPEAPKATGRKRGRKKSDE
jgi:hypothetical protein